MSIFITSVAYRRLRSFGSYENEAIEATAIVEDGQDPGIVLESLKHWVSTHLGEMVKDREELALLYEQVRRKRSEMLDVSEELSQLKSRRDKAAELLEKHGVDVTELVGVPL